jgi:phage baseplate assembly protein W
MTGSSIRALQFVHPDLDPAAPGLQLSPTGRLTFVEGRDAVRQSIMLLLSTIPGERVMRPEYGCDLFRLVFAPNDDTTAGLAMHYVRRAVERWERRAEVLRVDAVRHPDVDSELDIVLEYRVRATNDVETLQVKVDLMGVP